jgi:hypothetical protein
MASSRSAMEQQIYDRIDSDPQFREALKSDPKSALEQALGIRLPPDITIEVVQDTADTHYVLLPEETSGQPLSDQALESVAGGLWHPF